MKLIIAGAFPPELALVRKYLKKIPLRHQRKTQILEVGIGANQAAIKTTQALHCLRKKSHQDYFLLFIGSLGSTTRKVPLLQLISATKVVWCDLGLAEKKAYLPQTVTRELTSDSKVSSFLSTKLKGQCILAPVYTPPSISSSTKTGNLLETYSGASFENLELFAVAQACALHNVRWSSLSTVTNYVGAQGHQQWRNNYQRAAQISADAVEKVLGDLCDYF